MKFYDDKAALPVGNVTGFESKCQKLEKLCHLSGAHWKF